MVKLSLTLTSGVTLFDSSVVTTQEFFDNVVDAIAENCGKNFLPVKIKHNQIQLEYCM